MENTHFMFVAQPLDCLPFPTTPATCKDSLIPSYRVPRQPMCVFCSVDNCVGGGRLQAAANSRGVSGAVGDNKYVRHAWTARFLGQAGVGHVAAAVNA